jgi:hypothetical protein
LSRRHAAAAAWRIATLRARIAELVAAGPMRCREAHAVLRAEGWDVNTITCAKRHAVTVRGATKGSWWYLNADWQKRVERAAQRKLAPLATANGKQQARAARKRAGAKPPLAPPPCALRPTVPPPPSPRVCRECGVSIGRRGPSEPDLCLRHQRSEAA